MSNGRTFRQLRYALRFECSYQRAVSGGFAGDRTAWINSYPSINQYKWS